MTERRFLHHPIAREGGEVSLSATAVKHAHTLRLDADAAIVLFDGAGGEADATIVSIDAGSVRCAVGPRREVEKRAFRLVLCQCLPKGAKLGSIVRAATEIGAAAIHLVESERSVRVRGNTKKMDERLARLARIANEAARQSDNAFVPPISPPAPFEAVVARIAASALRLVFVPGTERTVTQAVHDPVPLDIWIVVGPEGGLAPTELDFLRAEKFLPVGLFDTVLRVETAAPVALALVRERLRSASLFR